MADIKRWTKDPDSQKDYLWDWATWLDGDTIASAAFTVEAGLTKASETSTPTTATVWLTGGTIGVEYEVTCRVTTAAGRVDDRTAIIYVEHT